MLAKETLTYCNFVKVMKWGNGGHLSLILGSFFFFISIAPQKCALGTPR